MLLVELEHGKSWANSRGQYDAQERQRIAGSLYRAGSAIGDERQEAAVAPKAVIVALNGEYIAIERDRLEAVIQPPAQGANPILVAAPRQSAPLYRRIAKVMLGREEIRSIWPSRQQPVAWKDGDTSPLHSTTSFASSTNAGLAAAPSQVRVPIQVQDLELFAVRAISKGAQPAMLTSFNEYKYNLVEYDGLFYGLPYGLAYDWDDPNSPSLPGVIVAESAQKAMRMIRERTQTTAPKKLVAVAEKGSGPAGEIAKVPQLIGTIDDYNIVSYEGFVYGLPQALGPIDLMETDAIEIEGVIRDVSLQVVENEIRDLQVMRQQAAE